MIFLHFVLKRSVQRRLANQLKMCVRKKKKKYPWARPPRVTAKKFQSCLFWLQRVHQLFSNILEKYSYCQILFLDLCIVSVCCYQNLTLASKMVYEMKSKKQEPVKRLPSFSVHVYFDIFTFLTREGRCSVKGFNTQQIGNERKSPSR